MLFLFTSDFSLFTGINYLSSPATHLKLTEGEDFKDTVALLEVMGRVRIRVAGEER